MKNIMSATKAKDITMEASSAGAVRENTEFYVGAIVDMLMDQIEEAAKNMLYYTVMPLNRFSFAKNPEDVNKEVTKILTDSGYKVDVNKINGTMTIKWE